MNKNSKMVTSPIGTGTLAKAFQILEMFQVEQPSWTQAELSRATGLQRAVVSRIARYLDGQGFIVLNPASGKYRLGPAAIDLGRRAEASFDLSAVCQPILVDLADRENETVILTKFDKDRQTAVCIDQIESQQEGLRVFEKIGTSFPLHAGAAPKAILALLADAEQADYLAGPLISYTDKTKSDSRALRQDLELSVARGYAISHEETYPGVVGIAAGFVDGEGAPVGSIAIAGPIYRFGETRIRDAGHQLRDAANEIARRISGVTA